MPDGSGADTHKPGSGSGTPAVPQYDAIPAGLAPVAKLLVSPQTIADTANRIKQQADRIAGQEQPLLAVCQVPWGGQTAQAFQDSARRAVDHLRIGSDSLTHLSTVLSTLATEMQEAVDLTNQAQAKIDDLVATGLPGLHQQATQSGDPAGWPKTPDGRQALQWFAEYELQARQKAYRAYEFAAGAAQKAHAALAAVNEAGGLLISPFGGLFGGIVDFGQWPAGPLTDALLLDTDADLRDEGDIFRKAAVLEKPARLDDPAGALHIPWPIFDENDPWSQVPGPPPDVGGIDVGAGSGPITSDVDDTLRQLDNLSKTGAILGWPTAAWMLQHFMHGNGKPVGVKVDAMLDDIPPFRDAVSGDVARLNGTMSAQAAQELRDHPENTKVMIPFQSEWGSISQQQLGSVTVNNNESDWRLAVGSFSYSLTGYEEAVRGPDGQIHTSIHYQVHIHDRYNFSDYKTGPLDIPESSINDAVRAGRAQEFDITGDSSQRTG